MSLFRRDEGEPIQNLSPLRRMLPHVMVGRNESIVFFDQKVDVTHLLQFLEETNSDRPPEEKLTFFHVVLAAIVRTLGQRPQLNRFVLGRKLYQRRRISLSFAVKKEFSDKGQLTTVKIDFDAADSIEEVARKVRAAIGVGRGKERTTSEKEVDLVLRLPSFLIRLLMWGQRVLDGWNLLPAAMIRNDPLYASVFLANLGSIGLDAPYHHLYEYGTVPLFIVIGRIKRAPVVTPEGELAVGQVVELRYSYDERVADGFYAARSLELFRDLIEAPEKLSSGGGVRA